jgi:glucose-1-phosphate cytidylyltransferase
MQVVILCGGKGTRIRDVAEDIPKPMIPIGDRPILWHIMKGFAHHGFSDFILCLGHRSWVIKRYFLDLHLAGADFSIDLRTPERIRMHVPASLEEWRITMAETGIESMTGCRIKRIEKYITGENFLLTYGDGVSDIDIRRLVQFHLAHGRIGTVTAVQPPGRFGEIELAGTEVQQFNEKPLLARGRINGGFFVFNRRFFERLEDDPELVLEQEPLRHLARDGELKAHLHDGFWQPMDNSREYQYLNDLWSQGKAPWAAWKGRRHQLAA